MALVPTQMRAAHEASPAFQTTMEASRDQGRHPKERKVTHTAAHKMRVKVAPPTNIKADPNAAAKVRNSSASVPKSFATPPQHAARSRAWIPLAYPKQAVIASLSHHEHQNQHQRPYECVTRNLHEENDIRDTHSCGRRPLHCDPKRELSQMDSASYFPLHPDILLATARELLIFDGVLDSKTLTVDSVPSMAVFANGNDANNTNTNGNKEELVQIPPFLYHTQYPAYKKIVPDKSSSTIDAKAIATYDPTTIITTSTARTNGRKRSASASTTRSMTESPTSSSSSSSSSPNNKRHKQTTASVVSPCASPKRAPTVPNDRCEALATSLIIGTPLPSRLQLYPQSLFSSVRSVSPPLMHKSYLQTSARRPRFRPRLPNKRSTSATETAPARKAKCKSTFKSANRPAKVKRTKPSIKHKNQRHAAATKPMDAKTPAAAAQKVPPPRPVLSTATLTLRQITPSHVPTPERIAQICIDRVWNDLQTSSSSVTNSLPPPYFQCKQEEQHQQRQCHQEQSSVDATTINHHDANFSATKGIKAEPRTTPRKISVADEEEATGTSTLAHTPVQPAIETRASSSVATSERMDDTMPLCIDHFEQAKQEFDDIAKYFDLDRRHGITRALTPKQPLCDIPSMVHASISTETELRRQADVMTKSLVASFPDAVLRQFLGYHARSISVPRRRLERLFGCYLYDVSHAMFAWERTEWEFAAQLSLSKSTIPLHPMASSGEGLRSVHRGASVTNSPTNHRPLTEEDTRKIQGTLFDSRTVEFLGGMEPSSILPQAIIIARQRRQSRPSSPNNDESTEYVSPIANCNTSNAAAATVANTVASITGKSNSTWQAFAVSPKGRKYFKHHLVRNVAVDKSANVQKLQKLRAAMIAPGKRRRGHRLRRLQYAELCKPITPVNHPMSDAKHVSTFVAAVKTENLDSVKTGGAATETASISMESSNSSNPETPATSCTEQSPTQVMRSRLRANPPRSQRETEGNAISQDATPVPSTLDDKNSMSTDTAVTATATATYVANGEHSGSSSHSSSSSSISAACTQQPTHKKTKSIEAVDSNHAPKAPPSTSQTAKWLEWRQLRVLEETPCAVPITLSRSSLQESWDIGLSKEGNACVVTRVGRGRTIANNDDASVRLFCGDLILHVQNHGTRTETWSPGCPGSKTNLRAPTPSFVALKKFNTGTAAATNGTGSDGDDWFDDLVAIFKQSMELQLIVQRVGVATTVQSTP